MARILAVSVVFEPLFGATVDQADLASEELDEESFSSEVASSHENIEPSGKCWTTGNLPSTSAEYILSMPYMSHVRVSEILYIGCVRTLLIFFQPPTTPLMSKRYGLCSQKGPFLISRMKPTAPTYML